MGKHKACTGFIFFVYTYFSAQFLDGNPANSQPQTGTLCVFIQFFKAFKYLFLLFQRDTATRIRHTEFDKLFFLIDSELQGDLSFGSKLIGIRQQIDQYLL